MNHLLFEYNLLEWAIRLVMAVVIIRRRLSSAAALAWLTLVFFLPVVGLVLYLLLGGQWLGKRRARNYSKLTASQRFIERAATLREHRTRPAVEDEAIPMILQAEKIGGNPIVGGNDLELLPDSAGMIDRLIGDIDAAMHHVHLLYYIYHGDATGRRVGEALMRAAGRGVACRLLVDAVGARPLLNDDGLCSQMRDAGVRVQAALPVAPWRRKFARIDLRNHRKVAVIDGKIAYTGSQNIVDANYGHKRAGEWIDLSARVVGPVVRQFQTLFLSDWEFETGQHLSGADLLPPLDPVGELVAQCVPTGPSHESETFRRVLLAALNCGRRRIIITSPYLVPDEPTMVALTMAVDRGAQVQLIVPRRCDHPLVAAAGRAYMQDLLEAGVEIHLHGPGLLHAKTITVDDSFALLGSANLDIRSFHLNFEVNLLLYGSSVTSRLRFAQQSYLNASVPVSLEQWKRRPLLQRLAEDAAALFAPLL
jgi:cardiolipin synthase